jgi:hypothetical protein
MITFAFSASFFAKKRIVFGGGPAGGTFQVVANGIQVYKPVNLGQRNISNILVNTLKDLLLQVSFYK